MERTVRNDNTIAHDSKLYQIEESVSSRTVIVEEKINGKMLVVCQGKSLRYHQISRRPEKIKQAPVIRKKREPNIIPQNHPWRKFDINGYKRKTPQTAAA
jgi:ribosomal protein L24E